MLLFLDNALIFLRSDSLKKDYRIQYKSHKIHIVENDVLNSSDKNINEFAVKLKINHDDVDKDGIANEARKNLEKLKVIEEDGDKEIYDLIQNNEESCRVVFVRGIAGMGKSVLSKQIVYGWAEGEMYKDFKLCIMIECRELNTYLEKGENDKDKILAKFLKDKFDFNLKDGEGVLFMVDGLDELSDLHKTDDDKKDESVIKQLLNCNSQYSKSKIIVTGRPHIEHHIKEMNVGHKDTVEIRGLSDKQVESYINKFHSKEHSLMILKARDSSKRNLPIIHIPQFLNTYCCVAIMRGGKAIHNQTELYCWTLCLLLREHFGDKCPSSSESNFTTILTKYSKELSKISKICHRLLTENKIIFEGDMEQFFSESEKGKRLCDSLFVKLQGHSETMKYQFKHLSLMEFLAAFHICTAEKNMDLIKESFEKQWFGVVSFASGLIAGLSSEGIIKNMLVKAIDPDKFCHKKFLQGVLKMLYECTQKEKIQFEITLEIICYFIHANFKDKEKILTPIIKRLRLEDRDSSKKVSTDVFQLCHYLDEKCNWKIDEFKDAFRHVSFRRFYVNDAKMLEYMKYFEHVSSIRFQYIKINLNELQKEVKKALKRCTRIYIDDCEFEDKVESGDRRVTMAGNLGNLEVKNCKLTEESFRSLFDLGMSSELFALVRLSIPSKWWLGLEQSIAQRRESGDLHLRELTITRCNPEITENVRQKVRRLFKIFLLSRIFLLLTQ